MSLTEFNYGRPCDVLPSIVAYRKKEKRDFSRAVNIAVIAGKVAVTPYMSKGDQNRLWDAINNITEQPAAKDYTDDELQQLVNMISELDKRPVKITKADGKVISSVERHN